MTSEVIARIRADVLHEIGRSGERVTRIARPSPSLDNIAGYIDHTLLAPDASLTDIEQRCRDGLEYRFASVCVNPYWVAVCCSRLRDSSVAVCSVVGFPLGATRADVTADEARRALDDGAAEIDMVLNVGALKSGRLQDVTRAIELVATLCREQRGLCKVIIEAALLTDEEKVVACTIADAAGADYVKTSTGFGPGGATIGDVALMRAVVGTDMGIKASGGIRDLATARAMIDAGASRIGTSAGVRIVQQARGADQLPTQIGY